MASVAEKAAMPTTVQVYIDGEFFPPDRAMVSVFNVGFLYGDGVFEGLRIDLTAYDLYTAEEVFACGTLTEVVPLTRIDGRQIGVGGWLGP